MAFKILSEEEKLFMTEKQLEVYEKELRLYKERLAFVEQVEKMESAEIKKFTPSLRPIGEISSPELAPFENKGIGRIELKKTAAKVPDTELYAARTISKTDITGFIKATAHIMDRAGLNKELGGSLAEKAVSAGRLGTRNISISKKAVRAFAQRSFDSSVAERKAELTKKPVAEFDIRSFAAPERKVPELKKTSIAPMTAREFAKPALSAVQLDMPARASVFSSAVSMPERAAVKLNMPEKASVFSSAVTMPERSAVKLSVPAKAAVPAAEFRLAALSAPKLERRPVRKYDSKHFAMPALSRPELKTVTAAAPKLSSFEAKAVRAELDMPETMPALKLVDFHKPEVSAKVSKKAVPEIKSAEFEMPEIKAPNLVKSSRPEVSFGLEFPTAGDDLERTLHSVISSQEDLNTQMLYLLTVGRFYTYDYATSSGSSTPAQSTVAMQSLFAGTLGSQLGNFINQALHIKDWQIGPSVSTGRLGWEDMEVGGQLQGSLLQHRLLLNGNFGYREQNTYANNFVGDFNLRYLLNKQGTLSLKAYSETNNRYFSRSSLSTQGGGIQFQRSFNRLSDLFRRKPKTPAPVKKEK